MSVRSLKTPGRKWLLSGGAVVLAIVSAAFFFNSGPDDPICKGKRLSTWLDELSALGHPKDRDPTTEQAAAIRAIGTNGIPWMLSDLRARESGFHWRCNEVLKKQRFIKYRFPEAHERLRRATLGFHALGELAAPAIPDLLILVEVTPVTYRARWLASVDQQCLRCSSA